MNAQPPRHPLYADEDVPGPLIDELRARGYDVLTAQEDGRGGQRIPDPSVLTRATAIGRVVLTKNRNHFHRLHRGNPVHAGIVTFTDDPDRPALACRIDDALVATPDFTGQLVKVVKPNPKPQP